MVHDPVTGKHYPKMVYYTVYGAESTVIYPNSEVDKLLATKDTFGPWHKVKELNLSKYYDEKGHIRNEFE